MIGTAGVNLLRSKGGIYPFSQQTISAEIDTIQVHRWNNESWGEILADFGNK